MSLRLSHLQPQIFSVWYGYAIKCKQRSHPGLIKGLSGANSRKRKQKKQKWVSVDDHISMVRHNP
jgi:hypothetical protein